MQSNITIDGVEMEWNGTFIRTPEAVTVLNVRPVHGSSVISSVSCHVQQNTGQVLPRRVSIDWLSISSSSDWFCCIIDCNDPHTLTRGHCRRPTLRHHVPNALMDSIISLNEFNMSQNRGKESLPSRLPGSHLDSSLHGYLSACPTIWSAPSE